MTQPATPPGWYPNPNGEQGQRYFDGEDWTEYRAGAHAPPISQRPKRKVWPWVLGGIILVIFLVIAGCVALVGSVANEISKDSPVTVQPSDGGTPSADSGPSFPGKQSGDTGVDAGGSATSDGVTTTSTPLSKREQLGNSYLCTQVTLQNNADKAATFNALFDWKLQDPAGAIRDASLFGTESDLGSGEIVPGGKVDGDVCFEEPNGSPSGTYVILFDPTFRLSSNRIGWVNQM